MWRNRMLHGVLGKVICWVSDSRVGRLHVLTTGSEVNTVLNACRTGSNRPNKSLSTTSVFACLCFGRVGISPGGPSVRSESHFILSGNRYYPTLCTALTLGNFFR